MVVGLGPAGLELTPPGSIEALRSAPRSFARTANHLAAQQLSADPAFGSLSFFDHLYQSERSFEEVYTAIAETLVAAASAAGSVAYAVPGSPLVLERTVELLREDPRVEAEIRPALSFMDLAWDRLGVDPVEQGVRLVDAEQFVYGAAGQRGPMLVAQCWSRLVLSDIKLAVEQEPSRPVTILQRLGQPDEQVVEVPWSELDRTLEPDHLTAMWIPELAAPVAGELARLDQLVWTLRQACPWDRAQTHLSLRRHLLEECYEVLEAIDALPDDPSGVPAWDPAVAHLQEELGDLAVQVLFHATLAAEKGWFTLADVAAGVHAKLVRRHPHVFQSAVATTVDQVAERWEAIKKEEKGRLSVMDGIPEGLPALALASKVLSRAASGSVGLGRSDTSVPDPISGQVDTSVQALSLTSEAELGRVLLAVVARASAAGLDSESALRSAALSLRDTLVDGERSLKSK